MPGFRPDEGDSASLEILLKRNLVDRDADLELGLFTNVAPGPTIAHAAITEPTGGGYARINLTDASWTGSGGSRAYAEQTFEAIGGPMTGSIQGYFIATKAAGGTKRLLAIEVDPAGPYTLSEGDRYKITPNISAT